MKINLKNKKAQSMMEIVIALALFVVLIAGAGSFLIGSFSFAMRSNDFVSAQFLAQEAVEAIKSIRDRDWNELVYSQSAIASTSGKWILSGQGTSEQIGKFNRIISFENVYRDLSYNIVSSSSPEANLDTSSTLLHVKVLWEIRPDVNDSVQYDIYLTNWR